MGVTPSRSGGSGRRTPDPGVERTDVMADEVRTVAMWIWDGLALRGRVLTHDLDGDDPIREEWSAWIQGVRDWLDDEHPTFRGVFEAASPGIRQGMSVSGLSGEGTKTVQRLDAAIGALTELDDRLHRERLETSNREFLQGLENERRRWETQSGKWPRRLIWAAIILALVEVGAAMVALPEITRWLGVD